MTGQTLRSEGLWPEHKIDLLDNNNKPAEGLRFPHVCHHKLSFSTTLFIFLPIASSFSFYIHSKHTYLDVSFGPVHFLKWNTAKTFHTVTLVYKIQRCVAIHASQENTVFLFYFFFNVISKCFWNKIASFFRIFNLNHIIYTSFYICIARLCVIINNFFDARFYKLTDKRFGFFASSSVHKCLISF